MHDYHTKQRQYLMCCRYNYSKKKKGVGWCRFKIQKEKKILRECNKFVLCNLGLMKRWQIKYNITKWSSLCIIYFALKNLTLKMKQRAPKQLSSIWKKLEVQISKAVYKNTFKMTSVNKQFQFRISLSN